MDKATTITEEQLYDIFRKLTQEQEQSGNDPAYVEGYGFGALEMMQEIISFSR